MEHVLGVVVLAVSVLLFVNGVRARRGAPILGGVAVTDGARRGAMLVASIISAAVALPGLIPALRVGFFAFCAVCPIGSIATGAADSASEFVGTFFLACWYYAATVIPIFILACLLSGVLAAKAHRIRVRGVFASFGLAAVLPVCSCGVVPVARAMMSVGGTGRRDGLVFLATAPLLSPVIILLGLDVLGAGYVLLRVAASLVLAIAVAYFVKPFVSEAATEAAGGGPRGGSGGGGSILLAGWKVLTSLVRFVFYGIILGSLFVAALPPEYVGTIVRSSLVSMLAAVFVGVPINMCAGEEILLIGPLAGMGFTMGHALAFSLASTGICVSAIPLLIGALGRRATAVLVGVYLVVPLLIGIAVNLIPFAPRLGMAPF